MKLVFITRICKTSEIPLINRSIEFLKTHSHKITILIENGLKEAYSLKETKLTHLAKTRYVSGNGFNVIYERLSVAVQYEFDFLIKIDPDTYFLNDFIPDTGLKYGGHGVDGKKWAQGGFELLSNDSVVSIISFLEMDRKPELFYIDKHFDSLFPCDLDNKFEVIQLIRKYTSDDIALGAICMELQIPFKNISKIKSTWKYRGKGFYQGASIIHPIKDFNDAP